MILGLSVDYFVPLVLMVAGLLTGAVVYGADRPKRQRAKRAANIARLERELGLNASETPAPPTKYKIRPTGETWEQERARQREQQRKEIHAAMERNQAAYAAWRLAHNKKVWLPEAVEQRNPAWEFDSLRWLW